MKNYAVVDRVTGSILNRIIIANPGDWTPPETAILVEEVSGPLEIGGLYIAGVYTPPVVPAPVLTPEEIARAERRATFDADATRAGLLARLRSATPAQIDAYVDANVTNLAGARALFKRILLVLAQT